MEFLHAMFPLLFHFPIFPPPHIPLPGHLVTQGIHLP